MRLLGTPRLRPLPSCLSRRELGLAAFDANNACRDFPGVRLFFRIKEKAADKNSTIIFPLPIELLAPFLKNSKDGASAGAKANGRPEDASIGLKDTAQSEQVLMAEATPAAVGVNGR
jgi:hypothetical protein